MKKIILIMAAFTACNTKQPQPQPGADLQTTYYQGEVLLPDYAHEDTLIVMYPLSLQVSIDAIFDTGMGTDDDIDSVLHIYCKKMFP